MSKQVPDTFRIGIICGKLGDVDGVSLEVRKWISILKELGHDIYTFAGHYASLLTDIPEDQQITVPEIRFGSPDQREYERLWNHRHRKYFESWLLVLLEEPHTKPELLSHYEDVFTVDDLPVVRHFSPVRTYNLPEHLDELLGSMQAEGKLALSGNHYVITDVGKATLDAGLKRWRFLTQ